MQPTVYRHLMKLAADQANVVTRRQALDVGLSSAMISRLVAGRVLDPLHRGVYVVAPWPDRRRQREHAAVLAAGPGALLSHESALRLHGIEVRGTGEVVHVTVPHEEPRNVGPRVALHTTRSLIPDEIRVVDGLRCTDAGRALVDVAWSQRHDLGRMTFEAYRLGVTTGDEIVERLDRLSPRKGAVQLRDIVERATAAGADRLRSAAETVAARLFGHHALDLVAAFRVHDGAGRFIAEVDFASPGHKVAVEIDGYRYHATPAEKRYDDRRQNRLVAAGWTVLRYTLDDLRRRPVEVVREIQAAIAGAEREERTGRR